MEQSQTNGLIIAHIDLSRARALPIVRRHDVQARELAGRRQLGAQEVSIGFNDVSQRL